MYQSMLHREFAATTTPERHGGGERRGAAAPRVSARLRVAAAWRAFRAPAPAEA